MPEIHAGTLLAGLLFGTIGFIAFRYGRKRALWKPTAIGVALMVVPYVVSNVWVLWLISLGLVAALWVFRE